MSSPTVDAIMAKSSYTVGDIEDSAEEVDIEIPVTFKRRKESRKDGESSTGGQEKSKAKRGKNKEKS